MLSSRGKQYASSNVVEDHRPKTFFNSITQRNEETVSLADAENFPLTNFVLQHVKSNISISPELLSNNQGHIGTVRLRNAMAMYVNDYFAPITPVAEEHVTFVTGFAALVDNVATNLLNEGEGILLGMPLYDAFGSDLSVRSKCKLVYTPFSHYKNIDQIKPTIVQNFETALLKAKDEGINVRAMIICNPHTSLGKCYPPETLKTLLSFCNKYSLHLISDERYALSVFKNSEAPNAPGFTSILSINTDGLISPDQVHVLYDLSKDFGLASLRLSCLITANNALTSATRTLARFAWPSEISISIATAILEDKYFVASLLTKRQTLLEENYECGKLICIFMDIRHLAGGNAGFFLWINLAGCKSFGGRDGEKEVREEMLNAGVELAVGGDHHEMSPGWFRIVFMVDKAALATALDRIGKVLHNESESMCVELPLDSEDEDL